VTFLQKLRAGQIQIGSLVTLPSPEVAELLSLTGFDWLWIDLEHGGIGLESLSRLLQAVRPPCHAIVRAPGADPIWIKRILDLGCEGLILPQVNTPEDAKRIVQWSKYPLEGSRSVGISRAHGYGFHFSRYLKDFNRRLALIVQIEHVCAVDHLEAIVDVPGVSAVLVGPYDLSASVGKTGRVDDPEVVNLRRRIEAVCSDRDMPLGIFAADAATAAGYLDAGYTFVAVGCDTLLLGTTAQDLLRQLGRR